MKQYTVARYSLERITVTVDSEEAAITLAKEADPNEWYIDESDYSIVTEKGEA